jgi:hypothetical protein
MHEKLKEWMHFQNDGIHHPLLADSVQLLDRLLGPPKQNNFEDWRSQEPVISMSGRHHFDAARDMVEV